MSGWNWRVVEEVHQGGSRFTITEVFYDEDDLPIGHAEGGFCNDSLEELKEDYEQMKEALTMSVLTWNEQTHKYSQEGKELPEGKVPKC